MGQGAYPDADDLVAILASAGLELDEDQVAQAVAAGIAAFESAVDRKMLAGAASLRVYGPPENHFGLLDLEADLVSVSSIVYQPANATAETVLAADYRLEPMNAVAKLQPYERIAFQRRWWTPHGWGYGSAMRITGSWGYGTSIPDDAWRAMLNLGVLWLVDMHLISLTGFLVSWKEEDVAENYAPNPRAYLAGLQTGIDAAIARYKKAHLF